MSWFESVAEAERRAKRILPPSVFAAIKAGTERGLRFVTVPALVEAAGQPV